MGKSRAEKVVCPLHPGTHRERMDPLGGLLEGERTGHRREDHVEKGEGRGGEEVTVQKVTLPPSQPRDLFSTPRDELQVDCNNLPS